jgi:quinol monooxygenase YgiN
MFQSIDKQGITSILFIFKRLNEEIMKNVLVTFEVDPKNLEYTLELVTEFAVSIKELNPGLVFYKSFTTAAKPTRFVHLLSFNTEEDYVNYRKNVKTKKYTVKLHALSKVLPVFTELNEVASVEIENNT